MTLWPLRACWSIRWGTKENLQEQDFHRCVCLSASLLQISKNCRKKSDMLGLHLGVSGKFHHDKKKKKGAPVQDSVLPGPNAGFMGSIWGPWQPELQWMGGYGLNWVLQLPERKEKKKGPPSRAQLWLLLVRKLGEVCRYWGRVPLGLGKHPRNPKSSCKWSDRFKGTLILPGLHFGEFPYRGNLKNLLENSTE